MDVRSLLLFLFLRPIDFDRQLHVVTLMPSYLVRSNSSRISKPTSLRRQSSSPFASAPRTKPISRSHSLADALEHASKVEADKSGTNGKSLSTIAVDGVDNVRAAIEHAKRTMFCDLPPRAGMNSTQVAEVLNYHRNMPSIVSPAHIHALVTASSSIERQISNLLTTGDLRKLRLIGRGNDISGIGEVLILLTDLKAMLASARIPAEVSSAFVRVLQDNPRVPTIASRSLRTDHVAMLTRAGFLVSSTAPIQRATSLSGSSLTAIPTISRAHSGTSAAIGGEAAFEQLGGIGTAKRQGSDDRLKNGELALSVPNCGVYAKLLIAGRTHFMDLLRRSAYREAPLYLLKEKWDGAVDNEGSVSTAKRIRGEFSEVMPAKTKKWAKLKGLNFDWVLEECLGAGIIELFETKAVGLGVRAVS